LRAVDCEPSTVDLDLLEESLLLLLLMRHS